MINLNYNIWLQNALGAGANLNEIFETFHSAKEIYESSENALRVTGLFAPKKLEALCDKDMKFTYKVISDCAENGIDIITIDDKLYPTCFDKLLDPPLVIYTKGDLSCFDNKIPFSIVGTRKPKNPLTLPATRYLSSTLSKSGFLIISGGAIGVDSAAHTGALLEGCKTVAVLGSGICSSYLKSNSSLRDAISENGLLITEHPPFVEPRKGFFPVRNRLIAALSEGVAVMEGGVKSGSLITAKAAYSLNKDVFVLPSHADVYANRGVFELQRDGAKQIHSPMDVLAEYLLSYPERIVIDEQVDLEKDLESLIDDSYCNSSGLLELEKQRLIAKRKKIKKRKLVDSVSDEAKRVYECFDTEPLSINEIADAAFMATNSVLGALTELELYGYLELQKDAKYFLKQEG